MVAHGCQHIDINRRLSVSLVPQDVRSVSCQCIITGRLLCRDRRRRTRSPSREQNRSRSPAASDKDR